MRLWTDLVTPYELTMVARKTIEQDIANVRRLARFFPEEQHEGMKYDLKRYRTGSGGAAMFRAYDAETAIGRSQGGTQTTVKLPALGRKTHVSEYDELVANAYGGDDSRLRDIIGREAMANARAVAERMELARGELLSTGKLTIDEDGFKAVVDFGRDTRLTVEAATKWDSTATAKPFSDLDSLRNAYEDVNGFRCGLMLVSRKVMGLLQRSDEIRKMFPNTQGLVSRAEIAALFDSHDLPMVEVFDSRIEDESGKFVRVVDENVVVFLPEYDAHMGSQVGRTVWGRTLEAADSRYGIGGSDLAAPGVVAGAYRNEDPQSTWVRSAAIGMPMFDDANWAATLKVLAS